MRGRADTMRLSLQTPYNSLGLPAAARDEIVPLGDTGSGEPTGVQVRVIRSGEPHGV